MTNLLTLVTPSFDSYGVVLDLFSAYANHSCDPNAIVIMDAPKLSFRALHSIKKNEEIFISYIDGTNSHARRKAELQERYFFDCQCSKCQKGPVLHEDTFLIPVEETTKMLKDIYPAVSKLLELMSLNTTKIEKPGENQNKNITDFIETGFLEVLQQDQSAQDHQKAFERYEEALRLLNRSEIWPIHRQPYAALRHEFFVTCLALKKYSQAFFHGLRAYFDIDPIIYPERHHPLRVVHTFTLSKLAVLFVMDAHEPNVDPDGVVEDARRRGHDFSPLIYRLIKEAVENVVMSHGPDNSFARMVRVKFEEIAVDMTRGDPGMLWRVEKAYENSVPFYKSLVERMVKY
jgi:SET and MYND domain-containing protein